MSIPISQALNEESPNLCRAGGFRDKDKEIAQDDPVFVKDDPNGKFCYCKPWDAANYKANKCDMPQ